MAERGTETIQVAASPQRLFDIVLDFERYPEWARDVKEVEVLERAGDRGRVVAYVAESMGRHIEYTLRYEWDEPFTISWSLVESNTLKHLEGSYTFDEVDDETTDVTYALEVDLGIPMPGFLRRQGQRRVMNNALRQLKAAAEGTV